MKIDLLTKIALWVIAVMLILNFAHSVFLTRPAMAISDGGEIGRYQISSWAAYTGGTTHHSGYYMLDTVTGKVVDKAAEVHVRGE